MLVATLSDANLCQAQEKVVADENPFSVGVDNMSRYVWSGTDFGASPSIQPAVSVSKWGLTLDARGDYATNMRGIQEADLYLSYSIKDMISITVTDYFFPDEINGYKYFNYDGDQTGHVFEGSLSFNGTEKLPLTLLLATNFYGADARRINEDETTGKIQYSTYAEPGYAFMHFEAFMGFNLTTPDDGQYPEYIFIAYQMMFAIITPALITGAFVNHVTFKAYLIFLVAWQLLVYYPFVHMVWGGGLLAQWGVLDFAGGIVVHATAGFAALASVFYVGKRRDTQSEPNSIPLVAIGTGLLWFGWYGFNAGSELKVDAITTTAFFFIPRKAFLPQ